MRSGEYGINIYVNVGEDVSGATDYGIEFVSPSGVVTTKMSVDGVSIGDSPITADCSQIYAADEYLVYTTIQGDITEAGNWLVRSIIDINSQFLLGPQQLMKVRV
jgi:hypothetical protein